MYLPNTFEMHGPNLHDMASLLALQDAIATSTRHTSDVEKFRAIDHVVVLASCYANAVRLDLKTQAALILPQGRGDPRLHAWGCHLTSGVERALCELLRPVRRRRLARSAHRRQRQL